jgi:hypothetical protein
MEIEPSLGGRAFGLPLLPGLQKEAVFPRFLNERQVPQRAVPIPCDVVIAKVMTNS